MLALLLSLLAAGPLAPAHSVPAAASPSPSPPAPAPAPVKVTVLSTMLTDAKGVGEWGFAALVEVGDRRYLFDTGARPAELSPGVWITGPVPRVNNERNWSRGNRLVTAAGFAEDTMPEDQALILLTADGPLVITGCGHAGIVNIMQYAERVASQRSV